MAPRYDPTRKVEEAIAAAPRQSAPRLVNPSAKSCSQLTSLAQVLTRSKANLWFINAS